MRGPSLGFALRAILRMSQFAPCELVLLAQEKVPKEKCTRSPHRSKLQGRFAALPMRSSPFRERAQLVRSLHSGRVRALFPDCLRYSVRATGLARISHRPGHHSDFGEDVEHKADEAGWVG